MNADYFTNKDIITYRYVSISSTLDFGIVSVNALPPPPPPPPPPASTVGAQNLSPPTQKRSRLWLATIHSRVS